MIVSHRHKFIFIKTEKTAGTSLEIALSEFCGPDDIITPIVKEDEAKRKELGFRSAQNFYIPFSKYTRLDWGRYFLRQRRAFYYNHMSAAEAKKLLGDDIWNSYYKFSFDRNPWDKMISWFYWKKRKFDFESIDAFIDSGMGGQVKGYELYTIGGVPAVDDIFKYESLDEALQIITKKIGFDKPLKMPEYVAKGGTRKQRAHYSEILSTEAAAKIKVMAAREIALLGYSF